MTARPQSDLDLVAFTSCEQKAAVFNLREALEESSLPFPVDLFIWDELPESFRKRIEAEHVVLVEGEDGAGSEWRETCLGEVIELKRGYDLPQHKRVPGSVPLVSSSGVSDYHEEAKVKGPGVVTGRYGTLGQVFFVPDDFWPLNTTLYVRQFKGNDPRFISYFLRELDFSAYSDKAAVPGLNRNHLHQATVRYPTHVSEQRAIAHILGTLDDKIELNRRMNETLEEMARALFKSWFVDFDPVRAKMEGRDTGLPPDVAALFPDRLVDSELGEIPEGWEVVPLPKIMDFKEGPGIRNWQYTNSAEGTRFINIRCIQGGDLLLSTANRIKTEEANGKYAHFHLKEWDIVVSTSGTLGRSAVVRRAHLPLLLNTSVIRFRPVDGATSFSYLHGYLNSPVFLDELVLLASGSVQKNFGPTHLNSMRILCPPYNCVERYEEIAGAFLHQVLTNRTENDLITALRDTLLPKLVSGEIRVNTRDEEGEAVIGKHQ